MTRDVFVVTGKPVLHKRCCETITEYIRDNYTAHDGTLTVDAIVAPDAKGFLFASTIAMLLGLPFIPIRKANKLLADPDDLVSTTYHCQRRNEVSSSREIHHPLSLSIADLYSAYSQSLYCAV